MICLSTCRCDPTLRPQGAARTGTKSRRVGCLQSAEGAAINSHRQGAPPRPNGEEFSHLTSARTAAPQCRRPHRVNCSGRLDQSGRQSARSVRQCRYAGDDLVEGSAKDKLALHQERNGLEFRQCHRVASPLCDIACAEFLSSDCRLDFFLPAAIKTRGIHFSIVPGVRDHCGSLARDISIRHGNNRWGNLCVCLPRNGIRHSRGPDRPSQKAQKANCASSCLCRSIFVRQCCYSRPNELLSMGWDDWSQRAADLPDSILSTICRRPRVRPDVGSYADW